MASFSLSMVGNWSFQTLGIAVVPEPSRALLMLIGLLAFGFRRRRIQD